MVPAAAAFIQIYATKLDPSQGCSFMLGLLCFQTSSQAPKAAMPPALQCTMAAAHAIASRALTEAPRQWHEAVLAELPRLLSAAPDGSSPALSIQTGGPHHIWCPVFHIVSERQPQTARICKVGLLDWSPCRKTFVHLV